MTIFFAIAFIIFMGVLARLSGNGWGKQWNASWIPELVFTMPFGIAAGHAAHLFSTSLPYSLAAFIIGWAVSYSGMQSATWYFLRWKTHIDPNTTRGGTLKPLIDWLAAKAGYKLGDEGYSWIAAAVKGFIIGLPVGGVLNAILFPLGYEIGSHAKGRVERFGIDPHAVAEFMSGVGCGISIVIFLAVVN